MSVENFVVLHLIVGELFQSESEQWTDCPCYPYNLAVTIAKS